MPACSSPRSSVFGRRPTADSRWLPSISCAAPAAFRARRMRVPPPVAKTLAHCTDRWNLMPSRSRIDWIARETSGSSRAISALGDIDHRDARRRSGGTSARTPGRCSCRRRRSGARAAGRWPSSSVLVSTGTSVDARASRAARARPPTLMKMRGACSCCRPAAGDLDRIWRGEAGVAPDQLRFVHAVQPVRQAVDRLADDAVLARLHGLHVDADRRRRCARRSRPRCRATCAARALATSVFVGMQPSLTQVPPRCSRSTSAVFRPAPASRAARKGPAWPLPMTMAS